MTTGLYYTPSGRLIQAKGIAPDIEVMQEGRESQTLVTYSEAALTNHLKIDDDEQTGSDTFIPSDSKYDRALQMAVDLLQGTKTHRIFPPGQSSAPN